VKTLPKNLNIGVIRGGISPEYDVSIKTGANILKHLSETHRPLDIFISKDGKWHVNGIERNPDRILKHLDVVYNALHGAFGEDGKIQEILDHHKIPYTGSGKFSSAVAMNKFMTKEHAKKAGIKTPIYMVVRNEDNIDSKMGDIHKNFPYPVVIKPVVGGSSIGMTVARTPQEILEGLERAIDLGGGALVEEYIQGKDATCGVLDNYRGQNMYAMPPVGMSAEEIHSRHFSLEDKKEMERVAKLMHEILNLQHYSESDFIVSPKRGVYFLEVNTLPGLTNESLFPKALEAVGMSMNDFLHHTINLALNEK
jgi:D-alanine-D-alanine ligase